MEDLNLCNIEKGHDILLFSPETILGKYRNTVAALEKMTWGKIYRFTSM